MLFIILLSEINKSLITNYLTAPFLHGLHIHNFAFYFSILLFFSPIFVFYSCKSSRLHPSIKHLAENVNFATFFWTYIAEECAKISKQCCLTDPQMCQSRARIHRQLVQMLRFIEAAEIYFLFESLHCCRCLLKRHRKSSSNLFNLNSISISHKYFQNIFTAINFLLLNLFNTAVLFFLFEQIFPLSGNSGRIFRTGLTCCQPSLMNKYNGLSTNTRQVGLF